MNNLVLALVGIIVTGGIAYLVYKNLKQVPIETEKVDKLTMGKIIEWFKGDEVKSEILKKPNLISVVLKGKEIENYMKNFEKENQGKLVLVGLLDNSKGELLKAKMFVCSSIDQEILDLFGEKDLLVLK